MLPANVIKFLCNQVEEHRNPEAYKLIMQYGTPSIVEEMESAWATAVFDRELRHFVFKNWYTGRTVGPTYRCQRCTHAWKLHQKGVQYSKDLIIDACMAYAGMGDICGCHVESPLTALGSTESDEIAGEVPDITPEQLEAGYEALAKDWDGLPRRRYPRD